MGCNKYLKLYKWLWNSSVGRDLKNFEKHYGKSFDYLEQTVSRNVDVSHSASKDSEEVKSIVKKT